LILIIKKNTKIIKQKANSHVKNKFRFNSPSSLVAAMSEWLEMEPTERGEIYRGKGRLRVFFFFFFFLKVVKEIR
jgi:hypothetical protein